MSAKYFKAVFKTFENVKKVAILEPPMVKRFRCPTDRQRKIISQLKTVNIEFFFVKLCS